MLSWIAAVLGRMGVYLLARHASQLSISCLLLLGRVQVKKKGDAQVKTKVIGQVANLKKFSDLSEEVRKAFAEGCGASLEEVAEFYQVIEEFNRPIK